MKIEGIIYRALNLINGKCYIGKTTRTLDIRKNEHLVSNYDSVFNRAMNKHGIDNFVWFTIFKGLVTKDELNNIEKIFIKFYGSYSNGYNMTKGGDGTDGRIKSIKERQRISFTSKLQWTKEKREKYKELFKTDNPINRPGAKEKQIKKLKEGYSIGRLIPSMLNKKHSNNTKKLMSFRIKERGGYLGNKNPRYIEILESHKNEIIDLFINKEFTVEDISQILNVYSKDKIRRYIIEELKLKPTSGRKSKLLILKNEDKILDLYVKENRSIKYIHEKLNLSYIDIKYVLKFHNIKFEVRKAKLCGKDNKNYRNGNYVRKC